MNFNNTWRNYIKSTARENRFTLLREAKSKIQLLAEGKKDDAKKKYPIAAQFEVVDIIATQLRAQFGDRGISKYIMFASRCMEKFYRTHTEKDETGKYKLRAGIVATTFFEQVMGIVVGFHQVHQRLEEKDINKYTFDTLWQTLEDLPESSGEKKRRLKDKDLARQNSEEIYNENGIIAIRPLTTQASCYYGENPRLTNWCISTKSKRNYFDQYTKDEGKAFVITKFTGIPEGDKNHIVSLEFDHEGDLTQIWDAPNRSQNPDDLWDMIGTHLHGLEEKAASDAIASFRDPPSTLSAGDIFETVNSIAEALLSEAKEWILNNPPSDPTEAQLARCNEAERYADQEYHYVSVSWDTGDAEPGVPLPIYFYANLEVLWDLDKPEYEDPSGQNVLLGKDYNFWRTFENKVSDNLKKMGRPWSDMGGEIQCYTEDEYAKLEVRFSGGDSYHPDSAEGFESFVAEDCQAMENRGMQMEELLGKMLDQEVGVDRSKMEEDEWDDIEENKFYKNLESQLLGEEKGRSRQRGIYKFYCMIAYGLTSEGEKTRGLDDILADMRALSNVTIVTVAVRNQKVAEGRYIAGLSIKFIPSTPGDLNTPENVKARIVRDIKRLTNVHSLFKLSTGLIRLE